MKYKELGHYIPKYFNAEEHSVVIPITEHVAVAGPGKYGDNAGGSDFLVLVTNEQWQGHRVAWGEVFELFGALSRPRQRKTIDNIASAVLRGGEIGHLNWFEQTVSVLCYCEHRRYSHKFAVGGGKALPLNILEDIHAGRNTAENAAKWMRSGLMNVKRVTYKKA